MNKYKFEIYIPKDCFDDTFVADSYENAVKQLKEKWAWATELKFKLISTTPIDKEKLDKDERIKRVLNDVFDNFDFERVKKTMDALDWKWDNLTRYIPLDGFKEKKDSYVPTLEEIKEEAARLMWECATQNVSVIATGGFRVEKDFSDPDDPWMRLSFEVTDWDASASEFDE